MSRAHKRASLVLHFAVLAVLAILFLPVGVRPWAAPAAWWLGREVRATLVGRAEKAEHGKGGVRYRPMITYEYPAGTGIRAQTEPAGRAPASVGVGEVIEVRVFEAGPIHIARAGPQDWWYFYLTLSTFYGVGCFGHCCESLSGGR